MNALLRLQAFLHEKAHKLCHRGHTVAECTYLSAVSYEAHGMYAYAALALLVVVVAGVLVGESS